MQRDGGPIHILVMTAALAVACMFFNIFFNEKDDTDKILTAEMEMETESEKQLKNTFYPATLLQEDMVVTEKVDAKVSSFLDDFYTKVQNRQYLELKTNDYFANEEEVTLLKSDDLFVDYHVLQAVSTPQKDKYFITTEISFGEKEKKVQNLVLYPKGDGFQVSFGAYLDEAIQHIDLFEKPLQGLYEFLYAVKNGEWTKAIGYLSDDISLEAFKKSGITDEMVQKAMQDEKSFTSFIEKQTEKHADSEIAEVLTRFAAIAENPFIAQVRHKEIGVEKMHYQTISATDEDIYQVALSRDIFKEISMADSTSMYLRFGKDNQSSLYALHSSKEMLYPEKIKTGQYYMYFLMFVVVIGICTLYLLISFLALLFPRIRRFWHGEEEERPSRSIDLADDLQHIIDNEEQDAPSPTASILAVPDKTAAVNVPRPESSRKIEFDDEESDTRS